MIHFYRRWICLVLWGVLGPSVSGLNSNQIVSYTKPKGPNICLALEKITKSCLVIL